MDQELDKVSGNDSWTIRPIRMEEAATAKHLIYTVAHPLMEPQMALEELITLWESWGAFSDLDDVQKNYFENGGAFLVTMQGEQMVGTGAFQHYREGVCEVRRITLLPEYRGRGMGYAMLMDIARRARAMGYEKMTLWTDRHKLWRAVIFYQKLGFVEVPHAGAEEDEIWMEMELTPPIHASPYPHPPD
jgi:putative acetyltransferase